MTELTERLYPDLVAQGGLNIALRATLAGIGSRLTVSALDPAINFVAYARIELPPRSSQMFIAAEERLFLFDCWSRGVLLANGHTPSLEHAARAIDRWLESVCTAADLAAEFGFITPADSAGVYERGEEVEDRWQEYLTVGTTHPELDVFARAAAARPELRHLFPYTSMVNFCFSRCTGYPFTRDIPHVRPVAGGYEVISPAGRALGRGDATTVAELVVRHLPPGCGPAVAGTADDLAPVR